MNKKQKQIFSRGTLSKTCPFLSVSLDMENKKARAKRLMDSFKLTIDQWDAIERHQQGLCALCGRKCHTGKRLATDHAHADGLIRGLLCAQCNPVLGKLENAWVRLGMHKVESITLVDFVRKLLSYLQSPPASTALGAPHYGYPGRVGTKKHRKLLKKLAREQKAKIKDMP